jgi:hypothetical protein
MPLLFSADDPSDPYALVRRPPGVRPGDQGDEPDEDGKRGEDGPVPGG